MSAWARPGAKCVCVDASQWPNLKDGATYTVSATGVHSKSGKPVLWLEGVSSGIFMGVDPGFYQDRFRPLITISQEQDVAKFRHLLVPSPIDAGLVPDGVELDA